MGILDAFTGLSPDENGGLLAAAAQMLQASGPSRTPTSFGQVLGQGIGGYQQAMKQAEELAQRKAIFEQAQALNGFKLKDAESDYKAQEAQRAEATRLAEFMRKRAAGGATSPMPAPQPAASMFGAAMSPQAQAPMQQAPAAAPASGNMKIYQERLQLAEELRNAGFSTQADAQEAAAIKFMPEATWKEVRVGERIMLKPYFKDGSSGAPVDADVAEKLMHFSTGGKTFLAGEQSGRTVGTYNNTMSPDAAASNQLGWANYNLSKSNSQKPTFSADAGGFVLPPSAANPTGKVVAPQGFTQKQQNAPVEFSKSAAGLNELQSALNNYEQVIKEVGGTRVLPSSEKGAKLKAAFTSVQMGLKNAMELGALAGPDIEILGGILADPTSITGLAYGPDSIKQQIGQTRKYLDNRTQAVEKVFGRKVPTVDAPKAGNGWSITKVN